MTLKYPALSLLSLLNVNISLYEFTGPTKSTELSKSVFYLWIYSSAEWTMPERSENLWLEPLYKLNVVF